MAEPIRLLLTAADTERIGDCLGDAVARAQAAYARRCRQRRLLRLLLMLLLATLMYFIPTRG